MKRDNISYHYDGMTTALGDAKIKCLYSQSSLKNTPVSDSTPHLHYGTEVHVIFDGECLLVTDDTFFVLSGGTICVVPPKLGHTTKALDQPCYSFATVVNFEKNDKKKTEDGNQSEYEYYKNIYTSFENVLIIKNAHKIIEMVKEFIVALSEEKRDSAHLANAFLKAVIILLARSISSMINTQENHLDATEEKQKLEVVESELENYIIHNYLNDLSIEDLAKYIGYSPAYTAKIIKKSFGMTYFELVTKMKMSYAKREILETDRLLSEIAESVGYNSYNGFSLGFKKYFGKTPEQVRKEGKK